MAGVEVRAQARNLRMSAQKVRLVLDTVRGKPVSEALNILRFLPHKATEPVAKCIRSASANAENNFNLDPDELGQGLLYGGFVLRIVFGQIAETAPLEELIQLPLRDGATLEGHDLPGLGVDVGHRLGRITTHQDERGDPYQQGDVQHPILERFAQDDEEPRCIDARDRRGL